MIRWLILPAVVAAFAALPAVAADSIKGQYVEARTCDVWTGPCFANAEINLTGKNAVMAWKIDQGRLDDVQLDGLGVVAVVVASDTLGVTQTGPAKAVLIVDKNATAAQRDALVKLAKRQGGDLLKNVVAVESAAVDVSVCECKGGTCAKVTAGKAVVETRCIDVHHDKVCGNESAFFPPLAKDVTATAAVATEHSFTGRGFNETWKEMERRSAYVGKFEAR